MGAQKGLLSARLLHAIGAPVEHACCVAASPLAYMPVGDLAETAVQTTRPPTDFYHKDGHRHQLGRALTGPLPKKSNLCGKSSEPLVKNKAKELH
ncbi:hypothetical protein NDU88_007749 [Pleurodeles waltl]|uniref:Uncharacterized protein n=1 Tax=Pleurodeles waltl TaxID=8319 RepID=A0AAV7NVS9_PLEWA|nr:hypothetical protein NDU88_007749 [Pleurodeles waltl]